jgi:hypothetical protein
MTYHLQKLLKIEQHEPTTLLEVNPRVPEGQVICCHSDQDTEEQNLIKSINGGDYDSKCSTIIL